LLPGYLPGYAAVDDDAARKVFEDAWGCSLNKNPGLSFTDMVRALTGADKDSENRIRLLYVTGENLVLAGSGMPGLADAIESVDFLVVQDILNNETVRRADVVLPSAAWAEDEGTYTNCERRVNRVRQAISGPGQVKPETWIFTELARRLGQDWPEAAGREIWENEIAALVPQFRGITYDRIDGMGLQWPVPDSTSSGTPSLNGDGPPLCRPTWVPIKYHHRTLLEQCEGLLESLPRSGGIGTQVPPSDPEEVTAHFMKFLEEEELTASKEQIDEILATYRTRRGGLIPVLQQIQQIAGFLPVSVQNYIAQGLGIPASDVFGVVTFYSFFTMVPRGRHIIRTCLGTACFVKGARKLLETLERHLKISIGETTEDREYSLDVVRCLGACGLAPVMVVDETTHGQVDPSEIITIVENYRG
ncbi:MAG: NADH-quinone oxidoreductase subunit NuoE, partial [Deltaproteobacteria bacterium]|nr:NADH-quinone oxidoreductase subunit NuoE [Deltaproteobacteria bacterium]